MLTKDCCGGNCVNLGLKDSPSPGRTKTQKTAPKKLSPREQIESQFIQTLIQAPELISEIKAQFDYRDITNANFVQIAQLLWDATENGEAVDIQSILNTCEDDYVKNFISNALMSNNDFPYHQARIEGCLNKLKGFMIQDTEQRMRSTSQDSDDYESSLKELFELSNQRRAVIQKNRSNKKQKAHQPDDETVTSENA